MDFGIFNLMGSREPDKPAAQVFGYRVLTSGGVDGIPLLEQQYADIVAAFAAENVPLSKAHVTLNRFAHITKSRDEGMRFAENARYQSRLASSLRRRKEVMQGTVLVDVPFPNEPPRATIYENLLVGDVETVELIMQEVKPRVERALS